MEDGTQTHQSIPFVSRLDHLEIIMKKLEGKKKLAKCSKSKSIQGVERQYLPLNLAVTEAYFKGSLLDRVATLESRLFQLCLELESSTTTTSSIVTSGDASSSQESKREFSCSLPTFNYPYQPNKQEPQVVNTSEIQGKASKRQQRRKQLASYVKQHGKNKPSKDEKACENGKKRVTRNWPHLKLLGC